MLTASCGFKHKHSRLPEAAAQAVEQFRSLAKMSSLELLAMSPDSIPERGLSGEALAQYRAVLATTGYFETAVSETTSLDDSFAEVRATNITTFGDTPLIILSQGLPDPLLGISEANNQQYEQTWQAMQADLVALSTNSEQIIAQESGHYIQLQEPQLVIDAIYELVQAEQISLD